MTQTFSTVDSYLMRYNEILTHMTEETEGIELQESIQENCIRCLLVWEKAAADMAENARQYVSFLPVRELACELIRNKPAYREELKLLLEEGEWTVDTRQELCLYQRRKNHILQLMLRGMGSAKYSEKLSVCFLRQLLPLLEGSVRLVQNAAEFPMTGRMLRFSRDFILQQRKWIRTMEKLLENHEEKVRETF